MVAPRSPSLLPDAMIAWHDRLTDSGETTWPANADGNVPSVGFMTKLEPGQNAELVQVAAEAESEFEWIQAPHGRLERITLVTYVDVGTDLESVAMLNRLKALANVVQRSVYDDTTTDSYKPLLAAGIELDGIVGTEYGIFPRTGGTQQATFGRATITYLATYRI